MLWIDDLMKIIDKLDSIKLYEEVEELQSDFYFAL